MRRIPFLVTLALVGCAGAGAPTWNPGGAPGGGTPSEDPLPVLVTASRSPNPTASGSGTVTATGSIVTSGGGSLGTPRPAGSGVARTPVPVPSGAIGSGAATPTPRPTATPSPSRFESETFFFTLPAGWTVESKFTSPEAVVVRATYGVGSVKITTDPDEQTLKKRQAAEETTMKPAMQISQSYTLDRVPGFVVAGNKDLPDGKFFLQVFGFIYREQFYALTTTWDKRTPEAANVERDVKTILASFRWL